MPNQDHVDDRQGASSSHEEGKGEAFRKKQRSNAATGASAASMRAIAASLIRFYFRAPAKAFFRTRVDYMAYAKAINPRVQAGASWSLHTSTPGLLAHAVKTHGWDFIPNQVLPPLLANITVGAVLYTSYLQTLAFLHEPSAQSLKRIFPPPDPRHTFTAGFIAGSVQSVVAAPLDAVQVRFKTSEMLEGRYKNMWQYAFEKLKSIGLRGVFAGWSLSFLKDSWGCAVFFSTFEYVKAQAYYNFLTKVYGHPGPRGLAMDRGSMRKDSNSDSVDEPLIKPHYLIEPSFILMAGMAASITQNLVQYPLSAIQDIHYGQLESLDYAARLEHRPWKAFRVYYHAYQKTFEQCRHHSRRYHGWRRWLYRGFLWNTIRQIPSTSAGLIVFEIFRRKYADVSDAVRIEKDGYGILLP